MCRPIIDCLLTTSAENLSWLRLFNLWCQQGNVACLGKYPEDGDSASQGILLHCSGLVQREYSVHLYLQDLQRPVPHWLCSRPAYWLIWVISVVNVTNLCRERYNWISATRITWASCQECMQRPQLFTDSKSTLSLEWASNFLPANEFTNQFPFWKGLHFLSFFFNVLTVYVRPD